MKVISYIVSVFLVLLFLSPLFCLECYFLGYTTNNTSCWRQTHTTVSPVFPSTVCHFYTPFSCLDYTRPCSPCTHSPQRRLMLCIRRGCTTWISEAILLSCLSWELTGKTRDFELFSNYWTLGLPNRVLVITLVRVLSVCPSVLF